MNSLLFQPLTTEKSASAVWPLSSSLTAHQSDWWGRPRWSWTYHDLLLATGTILLTEVKKELKISIQHNVNSLAFQLRQICVSSNKLLSKLPYFQLLENQSLHPNNEISGLSHLSGIPTSIIIIHSKYDQAVVERLIDTMKISSLNDKFAGTLGKQLKEDLGIHLVSDLLQFPKCSITSMLLSTTDNSKQNKSDLCKDIDLLFHMARGICNETVHDNLIQSQKYHMEKTTYQSSTSQKATTAIEQNVTSKNDDIFMQTPLNEKNKTKTKKR